MPAMFALALTFVFLYFLVLSTTEVPGVFGSAAMRMKDASVGGSCITKPVPKLSNVLLPAFMRKRRCCYVLLVQPDKNASGARGGLLKGARPISEVAGRPWR